MFSRMDARVSVGAGAGCRLGSVPSVWLGCSLTSLYVLGCSKFLSSGWWVTGVSSIYLFLGISGMGGDMNLYRSSFKRWELSIGRS